MVEDGEPMLHLRCHSTVTSEMLQCSHISDTPLPRSCTRFEFHRQIYRIHSSQSVRV